MFEPMRGSPIFLKAFQQGHRPVAAGSAWYGQGIDRGIVNNHPVLDKSLMSAIFENDMQIIYHFSDKAVTFVLRIGPIIAGKFKTID